MNHTRTHRFPHPRRFLVAGSLALTLAGLLAGGCQSGSGSGSAASTPIAPRPSRTLQDIEQQLVIGLTVARDIGYRVDWQYPVAGPNLKHLSVQGDSVFTLDENNFLTRISKDDGTRIWRIPVSYPLAEIQSVNYLPGPGRVIITSGGDLFVLNASDGSQIGRQRLDKIANTAAVIYNNQLIYGARNGQLIWHSHAVAFQSNGYQVAQSIRVAPVLRGNVIVTVGNDGEIMAIDAASASQYWRKKLLDGIAAPPVMGRGTVYIAGLDQHLWAYDLNSGRNLWSYLTESPLTDSPVLIDDQIFQQIPKEGLVCFDALPLGNPRGVIQWDKPDVSGNVITQRREILITWDQRSRQMVLLTKLRGGHVSTVTLPKVDRLLASDVIEGDLYAATSDGQVIRLVPRN